MYERCVHAKCFQSLFYYYFVFFSIVKYACIQNRLVAKIKFDCNCLEFDFTVSRGKTIDDFFYE